MKNTILILTVLFSLWMLGNGVYSYLNNIPNTKRITVVTFNDGNNGYSVSVPTGNSSTCHWIATAGDSETPYRKTTLAQTVVGQHIVYAYDYNDWIVTCTDDLGNHYTGIFPRN